jgi:type I restriction enzyme S subunit
MIDGVKPYPQYEEPGLVWLDRLPVGWKTLRGKGVFSTLDVRSETGKEEILTVSASDGVLPRSQKTVTMFMAKSYVGHKLCWPGDLVVNSLWAWMQGLGVSKYHGLISAAYSVYRTRPGFDHYWTFFHYLLRSAAYKWELQTRSKGVWLSRLQLSDTAFMDMPILLPSKEEAAAIVRFLNHATRRLNRAIRAKQKVIALLNEQKRIIIHRAVTRGLDPNVPLKASAVPWLGDIPRHWEMLQLRRVVSLVTSGSRGWARYYSESGDIFLQSGNLGRSMSVDLSLVQHVRPPIGSEGVRTRVLKDDILICITGALTGNVALVDVEIPNAYVNQHVALVRPNRDRVYPRFLAYVLYSGIGQSQFKTSEYGGTKQGLGLGDVKSVIAPLPSIGEQKEISDELDQQLACFRNPITQTERKIALLQEYRTRLIADVVTGKLDVREAAHQIPDEPGAHDLSRQEEEFSHEYDELDSGLTEREEADQMDSKMFE